MARRKLTEAAGHSGGVAAAARWQGCAKQLEKPSSPRREIGGEGNRITGDTGRSRHSSISASSFEVNADTWLLLTSSPHSASVMARTLRVEKPSSPRREIGGEGNRITGDTGKSVERREGGGEVRSSDEVW
jgi:hypothetical protein